jgi:predicted AlkP superfamily phosphohydrolase/phosphomutase
MTLSEQRVSRSTRVMVIGFDGATLDLIRPWAEKGNLPHFTRLMKEGAWGPLQSTMPPVTPAAWSSLATGTNPGKHGLYDFYIRRPDSYKTKVVNAKDRHGATLWELLSESGHKVTVFNIPASYPPDPVNGTMVSGFLTPTHAEDAAYPVEALSELKQAVPGFSFYPPAIFSEGEEVHFVDAVMDWDRTALQATEFLMNHDRWDFLFTVFTGVDILSHWMWRHMCTQGASVPSSDQEVRQKLADSIQNIYRQADELLGHLLQAVDEDTFVMIVSDHGFGRLDYYMHLNTWLAQRGYLKFKRNPFVLLKHLAFRLGLTPLQIMEFLRRLKLGGVVQQTAREHRSLLNTLINKIFLSLEDIDWSRTKAYTAGYGGPIFVNLKGRQPQGIIDPGEAYEDLLTQISAELRSLRHPETNELFVGKIYRPARDLYWGPYTHLAADLMFEPRDWANQGFGLHDFASNQWLGPTPDRTGTHRMNGVIFLHGPGIRAGSFIEDAAIIDVAPTILALMGVPIPSNMDGKVLEGALSEEFSSQLKITYRDIDESTPVTQEAPELSEHDEQVLRERLENLGYFG